VTHFIGVQSDVTDRAMPRRRCGARTGSSRSRRGGCAEPGGGGAIQRSLLPTRCPTCRPAVRVRYRPCDELAGDALNVVRLDEDRIGFYVLDVSGHGVPAALLSVTLSRFLSPAFEGSCLLSPTPPTRSSGPSRRQAASPLC